MCYNTTYCVPTTFRLEIVDMSRKWNPTNASDIVDHYLAGMSEKRLAEQEKIGRTALRRFLLDHGISPRGQSEAERLKWSRMDTAQRQAQVRAAHEAATGRSHSMTERIRMALSRERNGSGRSPDEVLLETMLCDIGVISIPQRAVGPYNCDLAVHPVAVEIWGGNWHWHGRHAARNSKRIRYFLDAGWDMLIVHLSRKRHPLTQQVAEYVSAYVKQRRGDPTAIREYRVVRGAGKLLIAGCADDDEITVVPAFRLGRNGRTGRYDRIPR